MYYQGCYSWDEAGVDSSRTPNYDTPIECVARCQGRGYDYAAMGYQTDEVRLNGLKVDESSKHSNIQNSIVERKLSAQCHWLKNGSQI